MNLTARDIWDLLTPDEQRAVLVDFEPQSPCSIHGHKYKPVRMTTYLFQFLNKTTLVCQSCGKSISV